MHLSFHAVQRFRERVEPGASIATAMRCLGELASDATRRSQPRHWTPVRPAPGVSFVYPHARPDVCLIVRDDVVVTVVDRALARRWAQADPAGPAASRTVPVPYRRPSPGSLTQVVGAA